MRRPYRVGFVQNSPRILRVRQNLADALALMKGKKADLWVLPEFFATGYNFKSRKEAASVAEPVQGGPTIGALRDFSIRKGCAIAAGFVEKAGSRLYNSAVLIDGKKTRLYRKTNLFGNERKFFLPGNTGFKVWDVKGVKVGLMICFDWYFPEAARALASKGARLIAHPSNLVLPWGPQGMKIRSLENRVFSVTANRVGRERGVTFIGKSQVVGPLGEVLASAPSGRPWAKVCAVDPQAKGQYLTKRSGIVP